MGALKCVILDMDPSNSWQGSKNLWNFPNEEINLATQLPFLDSEGLFFFETVLISETQFKNMSGCYLVAAISPATTKKNNFGDFHSLTSVTQNCRKLWYRPEVFWASAQRPDPGYIQVWSKVPSHHSGNWTGERHQFGTSRLHQDFHPAAKQCFYILTAFCFETKSCPCL